MGSKKRKYRRGLKVTSLDQVVLAMDNRHWLWLDIQHRQPKHPSVIMNMSLQTVAGYIRRGMLYYAVSTEFENLEDQ